MGKCVIFCAGDFSGVLSLPGPEDFCIAADGGYRHTRALGIGPDAVLGDFDSLGYVPRNAIVHPTRKDDTDAMLAVKLGLARGYREFILYGAMEGPRLDHTVAAFQTLQYLRNHGAWGYLVGKDMLCTVLREETLRFPAKAEGTLSLFCIGPDARGVSISGLAYGLENGVLQAGFPLGVSNHFSGNDAVITVKSGSLLCLWDKSAGLPERERLQKEAQCNG